MRFALLPQGSPGLWMVPHLLQAQSAGRWPLAWGPPPVQRHRLPWPPAWLPLQASAVRQLPLRQLLRLQGVPALPRAQRVWRQPPRLPLSRAWPASVPVRSLLLPGRKTVWLRQQTPLPPKYWLPVQGEEPEPAPLPAPPALFLPPVRPEHAQSAPPQVSPVPGKAQSAGRRFPQTGRRFQVWPRQEAQALLPAERLPLLLALQGELPASPPVPELPGAVPEQVPPAKAQPFPEPGRARLLEQEQVPLSAEQPPSLLALVPVPLTELPAASLA